eukprot:jgi/Mesvir1/24456/Mv21824-RA.2
MDFDPARVIRPHPVPDDLLCVMCTGLLMDPVEGPCEHLACRRCLTKWLVELGKKTCPECRHPLDRKKIKQAHRTVRNRVNALEVACANAGRGCVETMAMGLLHHHLELCGKAPEHCRNADCPEIVLREDLARHLQECPHRKVACKLCNRNIKFRDQEEHARSDCGGVFVPCQLNGGCGATMRRDVLEDHMADECSKGTVACAVPGCPSQVARGEMAQHLESSLAQHLQSLSSAFQGALAEISELRAELGQLRSADGEGPGRGRKRARFCLGEELARIGCMATLAGHTQPVTSLAMGDGVLYSASDDKSTRVWNLGDLSSTVAVENHAVHAMAVDQGVLYMGCPREIITWSTADHKRGPSVTGLLGVVRALVVGGGHIYCGITGGAIQVWSCSTHACITTMEGHFHHVTALALGEGMLFSASRDSTIRVWSTASYACVSVISESSDCLSLAVSCGFLCVAMADKAIKAWSTEDYTHGRTITEPGEDARALLAHEGRLYAGFADATIKVWLLPR